MCLCVYPPVCEYKHINMQVYLCVCVFVCAAAVCCPDACLWFMDIHYQTITAEVTRDGRDLLMHKTQPHIHTQTCVRPRPLSFDISEMKASIILRGGSTCASAAECSQMMRNKSPKHIPICYFPDN